MTNDPAGKADRPGTTNRDRAMPSTTTDTEQDRTLHIGRRKLVLVWDSGLSLPAVGTASFSISVNPRPRNTEPEPRGFHRP